MERAGPHKKVYEKLLKDGIAEDKIKEREDAVGKIISEAADFALKSEYPEFDDSMIQ